MNKVTTSERLNQLLRDKDLRQVDVLKKCEPLCKAYGVTISPGLLSQYVSGKFLPGQDRLTILSKALNVNEAWLMGYDVPMERTPLDPTEQFSNVRPLTPYIRLPKLGVIHAGSALSTEQGVYESEFADVQYGDGTHYMLDVIGDCMEPTIPAGSIAIIKKQDYANKGQVVAFALDGEYATLKRYFPQPDGSILLRGDNPTSETFIVTPQQLENHEAFILGVVMSYKVNL